MTCRFMGQFLIACKSPSCFLSSHSSSCIPADTRSHPDSCCSWHLFNCQSNHPQAMRGEENNIKKQYKIDAVACFAANVFQLLPVHQGKGFISRWTCETADLRAHCASTSRLPVQHPSLLHRESIVH